MGDFLNIVVGDSWHAEATEALRRNNEAAESGLVAAEVVLGGARYPSLVTHNTVVANTFLERKVGDWVAINRPMITLVHYGALPDGYNYATELVYKDAGQPYLGWDFPYVKGKNDDMRIYRTLRAGKVSDGLMDFIEETSKKAVKGLGGQVTGALKNLANTVLEANFATNVDAILKWFKELQVAQSDIDKLASDVGVDAATAQGILVSLKDIVDNYKSLSFMFEGQNEGVAPKNTMVLSSVGEGGTFALVYSYSVNMSKVVSFATKKVDGGNSEAARKEREEHKKKMFELIDISETKRYRGDELQYTLTTEASDALLPTREINNVFLMDSNNSDIRVYVLDKYKSVVGKSGGDESSDTDAVEGALSEEEMTDADIDKAVTAWGVERDEAEAIYDSLKTVVADYKDIDILFRGVAVDNAGGTGVYIMDAVVGDDGDLGITYSYALRWDEIRSLIKVPDKDAVRGDEDKYAKLIKKFSDDFIHLVDGAQTRAVRGTALEYDVLDSGVVKYPTESIKDGLILNLAGNKGFVLSVFDKYSGAIATYEAEEDAVEEDNNEED